MKKVILSIAALCIVSALSVSCSSNTNNETATTEPPAVATDTPPETEPTSHNITKDNYTDYVTVVHTEYDDSYTFYDFEYKEFTGKFAMYHLLITQDINKQDMLDITRIIQSIENSIETRAVFYSEYNEDETLENIKFRVEDIVLQNDQIIELDDSGKTLVISDEDFLNE